MISQIHTVQAMKAHALACHARGLRIGFVPTMGYLHDGHLSLIKIAQASCDVVVVSIFVNPTQFGAGEDLERYPHDMEGDLAKVSAAGAQVVFAPSVREIYDGEASVQVSIPALSRRLCGVSRPHHFDGVCQVVLKLFGAVRCDVAVFGEKDFQQLAIIRRLVKDLFLDTEIKSGPIVREPSGLAMSSRNVYLSPSQRNEAPVLFRTLEQARLKVSEGVTDAHVLKTLMAASIESASDARCEYVEIVDPQSLETLDSVEPSRGARALIAAQFGATRLIDNAALTAINI